MGWCAGSYIAQEVWDLVEEHIPKKKQKQIAQEIVKIFNEHDADDWGGCSIYEAAGYAVHDESDDDDEDGYHYDSDDNYELTEDDLKKRK